LSPLPKVLTGACPAGGAGPCPTADIGLGSLLIISADGSGQVQLQGHYAMNTEYTATVKAGAVVKDFYGKTWTNTADSVIKWKTAAAITMGAIGIRYAGSLVSVADGGTVVRPAPTTAIDIRLGFNASMDPTTLDLSEVTVEAVGDSPPPPTLRTTAAASDVSATGVQLGDSLASGCGNHAATLRRGDNRNGYIGACTLRLRGNFQKGTYKVTVKKDAVLKDIFGTTYTQAADQSATFTIEEAPAPVQCL
jgi:hypothetical protein